MFTKFEQAFEWSIIAEEVAKVSVSLTKQKLAIVRAITCDHLAEAIREHTRTLCEQTKALREHSVALLTKLQPLIPSKSTLSILLPRKNTV
jgi:hypothetical protein